MSISTNDSPVYTDQSCPPYHNSSQNYPWLQVGIRMEYFHTGHRFWRSFGCLCADWEPLLQQLTPQTGQSLQENKQSEPTVLFKLRPTFLFLTDIENWWNIQHQMSYFPPYSDIGNWLFICKVKLYLVEIVNQKMYSILSLINFYTYQNLQGGKFIIYIFAFQNTLKSRKSIQITKIGFFCNSRRRWNKYILLTFINN